MNGQFFVNIVPSVRYIDWENLNYLLLLFNHHCIVRANSGRIFLLLMINIQSLATQVNFSHAITQLKITNGNLLGCMRLIARCNVTIEYELYYIGATNYD